MQKKILVAVDQSSIALSVINSALELAKNTGSSILLVSVIDITKFIANVGDLNYKSIEGERKGMMAYLTGMVASVKSEGITIQPVILEGDPACQISQFAKENNVSLVVIGSRDIGKIRAKLLGSVSEAVTKNCECSVLVVKE